MCVCILCMCYVCMYVCMCVCMCVCMYVCMYVYMYACIHACMHIRCFACVDLCLTCIFSLFQWVSSPPANMNMDTITTMPVFNMSYADTNHTPTDPLNVFDRYSPDELYAVHRPAIILINKFLTPVWYIIGFPSNAIAFTIWIRPRMRPSSGCYLAALAMADFIFLILQLIFELQSVWDVRLLKVPVLCEAFPVFFLASQYISPMLVLAFTVERYISICHPFKRERYCTTSRAVMVIVGLIIVSLLLHAVQAYFWYYDTDKDDCTVRKAVTRGDTRSVWSIWSWITELLVFGIVPLAILVLNVLVIMEARKLAKTEETRLCLKRGHKSSAATVTLLAVSFYLIFTTLPVTLCYAMFFNFPIGMPHLTDDQIRTNPTWQRHFTYYTVKTIIQEIGMSHYACNFFIYLSTGKLFRRELALLILSLFCKHRQNSFSTGQGSTPLSLSSTRKANGAVSQVWSVDDTQLIGAGPCCGGWSLTESSVSAGSPCTAIRAYRGGTRG